MRSFPLWTTRRDPGVLHSTHHVFGRQSGCPAFHQLSSSSSFAFLDPTVANRILDPCRVPKHLAERLPLLSLKTAMGTIDCLPDSDRPRGEQRPDDDFRSCRLRARLPCSPGSPAPGAGRQFHAGRGRYIVPSRSASMFQSSHDGNHCDGRTDRIRVRVTHPHRVLIRPAYEMG